PVLWANFNRITFVARNLEERITFDLDLAFRDDRSDKKVAHLVIAELKQKRMSYRSLFSQLMIKYHVRMEAISKYCLGVTLLHPHLKSNLFKQKIMAIDRIAHRVHRHATLS